MQYLQFIPHLPIIISLNYFQGILHFYHSERDMTVAHIVPTKTTANYTRLYRLQALLFT